MIKRIIAAAIAVCFATSALALTQSSVPPKFPIPFASAAGTPTYLTFPIPTPSQIGIVNCKASLTDGFPPLSFVPAGSGGCPPFGQDFNGILRMITLWSQWAGAGAAPLYDAAFSSTSSPNIGGYPSGATLANATTPGCFWVSTADNNTSNPDTGGANWNSSCPGGGVGGTSSGSATVQTVSGTPIVLVKGATISYTVGPGLGNAAGLQINYNGGGNKNVFRVSQLGASLTVGGETNPGQRVTLQWDGTEWQCTSCAVAFVGDVKTAIVSSVPAGWLALDGSCQAQATYPDLYSVAGSIGSACSAGNFRLLDGRGTLLVGQDNQGGNGTATTMNGCTNHTTLGGTCGSQYLAQSALPNVTINIPSGQGSHAHTVGPFTGTNGTGSGPGGAGATPSAFSFSTNAATLPSMVTASINGNVTQTVGVPPVAFVVTMVKL